MHVRLLGQLGGAEAVEHEDDDERQDQVGVHAHSVYDSHEFSVDVKAAFHAYAIVAGVNSGIIPPEA